MANAPSLFYEAIRASGLEPPLAIEPGKFYRFPGVGKRNGNTAAWCKLFEDGLGGIFGDHSCGLNENWQMKRDASLSASELAAFKRHSSEANAQVKADQRGRQAESAIKAASIWEVASPAPDDHPYLVRKGINAHGARLHDDALILRVTDLAGDLTSLQFIQPDGTKRLLAGGRKKGCVIQVAGDIEVADRVIICEGWATGCSLAEAYPESLVLAAIDAGNLETVAVAARERWNTVEIVIAGDDDRKTPGNPGATKARNAAISAKALVALPQWPNGSPEGLSDFNDLVAWEGGNGGVSGDLLKSATPPDAWPQLVLLDTPNLPRLKTKNLPAWAGEFAQALSAATETPPELAAGMILATCATAAARRLKVRVKPGYSETSNLWIVVALPPGNRKSAVQGAATAPLLSWERDQARNKEPEINRIASDRKTKEARAKTARLMSVKEKDFSKAATLAAEAADLEADLPEVPMCPQLWTSDATPERLGSLLAEQQECMAWLSSEGGVFDLLQGRYSNGIPNLDLVLKAHSGDAERVDRGSRPPVFLRSPRLTIGLSPQPEVLRGLASKPGFRGRGLLARFLYLLPPSPLGYRTLETVPVPEQVLVAYAAGITAMLDWEAAFDDYNLEQPQILRMSDAAQAEHHAFDQVIEAQMRPGGSMEHCTDWAGKAPGAAARLAGVLHGIKHAHGKPWEVEISAETMNDALEIMGVVAAHSLAAMNMMGADSSIAAARHVWDWIERGRRSSFTEREAFNALRGKFPRVKDLKEPFSVLTERGYVDVMESAKGHVGRPSSPTIIVRPEIVRSWQ